MEEKESKGCTLLPEQGLYMGTVKLGPKGQIVIPKAVRDMFSVQPGDQMLLLADVRQGIALKTMADLRTMMQQNEMFRMAAEQITEED